jgi:hypothetical protein
MSAINGNTGNVSGTGIVGILNTWSATISRSMSDVTGFTNVGRNRLMGVYDMTGSAGGVLTRTAAFISGNFLAAQTAETGATVTLTALSAGTSQNTIQANVIVNDIAMNSTKTGDTGVTFSFSLAATATTGGSPFTLVWTA